MIELSKRLGIHVVSEGVETTEEQMWFLRERNCDLIQGYFYSRPIPAPQLMEQLLKIYGQESKK